MTNAVITFLMYDVRTPDLFGILTDIFAIIHSGHGSQGKVIDDLIFSRYLRRRLFRRAFRHFNYFFGEILHCGAGPGCVAHKRRFHFFHSHLKIP
jgi:hypothetical protein